MIPTDGEFDVAIIGGGIVGLATATQFLARHPDARLVLFEAERHVGQHQSGRNSGVLHSGIYYRPGSLKATLCRQGKAAMEAFCHANAIPFDRCGKVIVATSEAELVQLETIQQRASENGVQAERIDSQTLRELEPHAVGLAALHVPETGIVDYKQVCQVMSRNLQAAGAKVLTASRVERIETQGERLQVTFLNRTVVTRKLINCGGLQCDRILRLAGGTTTSRIIPFRGEYYELNQDRQYLCRNLIYPVPDPSFPFLGVHFTRMIHGGVECGPNAVLALAREGYGWTHLKPRDLWETMSYRGFHQLAKQHWRMGAGEVWRSLNKKAFVKALQKLMPSIRSSDLHRGRAGVRAQAVDESGRLIDDFLIEQTEHAIHVLNAPSPAATASLAIANKIVELGDQELRVT